MSSRDHRPDRTELNVPLAELERVSKALAVSDGVKDEAARICRKGMEMGNRRGSLPQVAASSVYAACREREIPMTLDEVAVASGVSKKELAKCYNVLVTRLDLKVPVANPAEYVTRVASRTKASAEVQAEALEILSKAGKVGVTAGVYPMALAASALYVASMMDGRKLTQKAVAEAAGVKEATVRKEYKRLETVLNLEVSPQQEGELDH
ncbi:MAG: hypothetical protein ABSF83_05390 [Nitrososphaerales archaeon]|jgi:transcription initiation factor TFIIB